MTIDGYSVEGASPNTLERGSDATLKVELSGENAGEVAHGLHITGSNSTVKGLIINRWSQNGILIDGTSAVLNKVEGNYIGLKAGGSTSLGNAQNGVLVSDASNNSVGGTKVAARNVISGNGASGVGIVGSGARSNPILANSIYANGQLGIDLGNDGVTPNDKRDLDTGPNALQNYPVLDSVKTWTRIGQRRFNTFTTIKGTLEAPKNPQKFTIRLFSSSEADPSSFGEGNTFLGETTVKTRKGKANFAVTFPGALPAGERFVTATATNDTPGDTSEFSAAIAVR